MTQTMAEFELIPYSEIASLEKKLTWLASTRINGVDMGELLGGIEASIQRIKTVLSDAERKQEQEPAIRVRIRRLKDGLHAADDFFDGIATELRLKHAAGLPLKRLDGGKVCSFFSCTNGIAFPSRIARKINEIQKSVDDIAGDVLSLGLDQEDRSERGVTTFSGSDIIGREDEKREIIESLLMQPHGNENVSLVSVVGEGGIGKTAVAQLVYNDDAVKGFFEKQMWMYVYGNFDVKTVVKKILESLTGIKSNDQESFKDLLDKLHGNLNGVRYLLVLDDVCVVSPEQWTQLRTYLMCGAQGSKILVTTRSEVLVQVMGGAALFPLRGLNYPDSWSLFKKLAFRNDHDYRRYRELEAIGKAIVMMCRGVPQAIRTVAIALLDKYEVRGWSEMLYSDIWELLAKEKDDIMSTQKLSYQHLPPHQLKQCFAYCSLYPMDWEIGKNELIQLWMAQGYLDNDEQQMEDAGNEFVNTLLNMSFFQDAKYDEHGNLVSIKIGNWMHRLALLVAGRDFYLDSERRVNAPTHMCLSLESNTIDLLGSFDASRLRTFILQQANDQETALMTRELSVILRFKRLRSLNLSQSSLKKLPDLIGKLKHLRYLDLSWCVKLASLPKSIGNLVNLQTLKLTGCEALEFSTEAVTKLINLRHLEIHRCKAFEDMMPAGLGKLSSLQSLSSFRVVDDQKKKAGKLNELQNLNNLRGSLEIDALDQVRDVEQESRGVNLEHKEHLESLDLNWENQEKTGDNLQLLEHLRPHHHLKRLRVRWYPGERFSDWLSSIEHLSYIYLFGFHNCKYLPPLEHLPSLKSLEVVSMKALEYIYFEAATLTPEKFFKSLERIKFSGCGKLQGWKRKEDDVSPHNNHLSLPLPPFLRLSQLIIKRCPKLTRLPTFPNVEELQLCESTVMPLRETLDTASSFSTSPLSMLRSLKIEGKLLDLSGLPSEWKLNLTSLEYLEIGVAEKVQNWFEVFGFPCLQKIVVYACDLQALPDKMCDLLSLQHIKILGCHKLASLPEGMRRLTNLGTLQIWDCPLLVERCQSETGVDWPKISHVPNIILKHKERR